MQDRPETGCARGCRTTMRYRLPHYRASPRRDGTAVRPGSWCRLPPCDLPSFFHAVSSRKIDTARYGDRFARGRAARAESTDDLARPDIAAAPGKARHTDGGRGRI